MAYKLKLPEGSRVHPVFHVSLLKKAIGEYQVESELPQGIEGDCADQFIPEDVLATHMSGPEGQKVHQVLIQWADRTVDEATWEDILTIKSQFPEFNLEDKVAVLGGSVVRDHMNEDGPGVEVSNHSGPSGAKAWLVYSRRRRASNIT